MDGLSVTVSPSKVSFHSVGASGVMTLLPQPQQHLWMAVLNGMEM
jgi:hypothetical protein